MKNLVSLLLLSILISSCADDEKLTFETETLSNSKCKGCAVIEIEIPRPLQKKKITNSISTALNEEIIALLSFEEGKSTGSISDAINSFESGYTDLRQKFPEESIPWEARINGEVIYENDRLVTIGLNSYIFTGGAHGYGSTHFLNFSKKNGEELRRNEIFRNREEFEEFAEMKFRVQESIPQEDPINSTGFMFDADDFYLPENIGFTEEGIKLLYNPYEVASYADGVIELTLPYTEIEEYLAF